MIVPMETLPTEQTKETKFDAVLGDILKIISDRIERCEIVNDGFSDSYFREVIKRAIRLAVHWKKREMAKDHLYIKADPYDFFDIGRIKGQDEEVHWYIRYYPEKWEEAVKRDA